MINLQKYMIYRPKIQYLKVKNHRTSGQMYSQGKILPECKSNCRRRISSESQRKKKCPYYSLKLQ